MKAVLWDNDGVLVDTERIFFETTRQFFAQAGVRLQQGYWARHYLGGGMTSRQIAESLGMPKPQADAVVAARDAEFRCTLERAPVPVRPGVRETIVALHGSVRMAVVTSCPRGQLELVHSTTGLLPYFDVIVCKEDCAQSKPAPDGYLRAMDLLGVTAEDCIAVEDSPRGVKAATAAGIRCVLIPTSLTDVAACGDVFATGEDAHIIGRMLKK